MQETKQEAKQIDQTKADPFLITTSGVMIVNPDALGDKLCALLCESINMFANSHVASVIIRTDNYPKIGDEPVLAMAYADTNSIAINLQRCWDVALEKAANKDTKTSLLACLWANVMASFSHELDHLSMAKMARDDYEELRGTEEGNKMLEEQAEDAAIRTIMRLAAKFDVEIPAISELGWFSAKIMELFMGDDELTQKAKIHAEEGIVYDDGNDLISSFREYVKRSYPDSDEIDWEQGTTCVNINAYIADGTREILKANPVIAPTIDAVVLDENAAKPVETVITPGEAFIGAGMEVDIESIDYAEVAASDAGITVSPEIADVVDMAAVAPTEGTAADAQTVAEAPVQPVPEVVAAQNTLDKQAAPPEPVQTETPYEPNNLSNEVMAQVMEAVYKRLYTHIFTKCGWSVNPSSGHYYFAAAGNVVEHVGIQDILDTYKADNFIKSYDTVNKVGQGYEGEDCNGTIRGFCTSKAGLPCYNIYLNIGGQRIKRTLIPQNPQKRKADNTYSAPALEAQAGQAIARVMKGEAPKQGGSFADRCAVKISTILNAGQPAWNYEVIA